MTAKHRDLSRARQVVVAILSGVIGRAVTLLSPLIVMAPMLECLGPTLFGIWLTAVALAGMASFLDFGIGNAVLTRLSEAFGQNDLITVRRLLGQSYTLIAALSCVFITLVQLIAALYSARAPTDGASDAALVVAVVLTALFLSFPALLITKVLQARQAFVQSQLAQVAGSLMSLVACLLGIQAGVDPVGVVALYALSSAAVLGLWSVAYFILAPEHRPSFQGWNRDQVRNLLSLGGAFFLVLIFYVIGMNADNVILAARAGLVVVAEYGVPAKLGSILMVIVGTVFMPLWPVFGNALAQRDRAWLRTITLRMSLGGGLGVLVVGLGLTALSEPIMTAWMGRPFADQHLILLGWTAAATVIALTAPYNMVLNAAGLARPQILPWAAFVGMSIAAKVAFLGTETAWWAPWITAGVYAVTISPWMMRLARREMAIEVVAQ